MNSSPIPQRFLFIKRMTYLGLLLILTRLFYWQIIKGPELRAIAQQQYTSYSTLSGERGQIFTKDGHVLVGNKDVYTVFVQPKVFESDAEGVATQLTDILTDEYWHIATSEAEQRIFYQNLKKEIAEKLSNKDKQWVSLYAKASEEQKQRIQALSIHGVGFDRYQTRFYPEASLAAQVVGFVGKNDQGKDTGYFGIEGQLNLELEGKNLTVKSEKDAKGIPILSAFSNSRSQKDGRDVTLTIHRDIQYMLEEKLIEGIAKYGAESGEAVIMDPKTGDILAMASFPSYEPEFFFRYDPKFYKNPLSADAYEPGSTFKVITTAAGIDAGVITPDTTCTNCATARTISGYTLKTWNEQYNPNISIKDALAKSDNTAMIFIAEKVGIEQFKSYMEKFEINSPSGIELQEDAYFPMKEKWRQLDLATASFGQGIAITGMQMMRAVSAIANEGVMVKPKIIDSVVIDGETLQIPTQEAGNPISKETANTVTDMMVYAAQKGESQWTTSKKYTVAGKTGTAQIPVAGHYDEEKTMASYIGFAPAYNPKFIMLVKLREPKSSPWASETAAPLWYDIAEDLFQRMNIPPDR